MAGHHWPQHYGNAYEANWDDSETANFRKLAKKCVPYNKRILLGAINNSKRRSASATSRE